MTSEFSQVNTLLFDMDGTLTDLGIRWWDPFHRAYGRLRGKFDEDQYKKEFENALPDVINASTGNAKFVIPKVIWKVTRIMRLNLYETLKLLYFINSDPLAFKEIVLLEHADHVITELRKRGYKLALVTTASIGTVKRAKDLHSAFAEFDTIVTRDDVVQTKPDPEPLFLACSNLSSQMEDAVMIGDFPQDVMAGINANAKTIAVLGLNGKFTESMLRKAKPTLIVDSLIDLLRIFPALLHPQHKAS